jgi:hypothetical protein
MEVLRNFFRNKAISHRDLHCFVWMLKRICCALRVHTLLLFFDSVETTILVQK